MTQREAIAHIVSYVDYAETIGEKTKHLQACAVLQEAVSKLEGITVSIPIHYKETAINNVASLLADFEKVIKKYNDQDQAHT
jgi:hypothetical protein